jgi:DNA-binding GntR family transcriptional regulator
MSLPISNAEHIYRSLRRSIIHGELAPGERLLIRAISEQFGTSSSPVIEAIRRLEQEGLVVTRTNAGAQVKEWSSSEIVRSYMTRNAIDGVAARLFVEFASNKQRDTLRDLNEKYRQDVLNESSLQWCEADANYHMHVVSSVMPEPVEKLMEVLYAITMTLHNTIPGIKTVFPLPSTHDDLTEILTGDDPEAAERAAFYHVSKFNQLAEMGIIHEEDIPRSIMNTAGIYELAR